MRAVGGLTTAEVASAFLVPEATMAQRISRAKQRVKATGPVFRLRVVLYVLYLIFNEGYTATSGPRLQRADLTGGAIRLTRVVHALVPDDGEVTGPLALMLLTDSRRAARTGPHGDLIPLAEQDRGRWNRQAIQEGIALISATLPRGTLGPYQLRAAIAAVHAEAADPRPVPAVGPRLAEPDGDAEPRGRGPDGARSAGRARPTGNARRRRPDGRASPVARGTGTLWELAGEREAARERYLAAARRTLSLPRTAVPGGACGTARRWRTDQSAGSKSPRSMAMINRRVCSILSAALAPQDS